MQKSHRLFAVNPFFVVALFALLTAVYFHVSPQNEVNEDTTLAAEDPQVTPAPAALVGIGVFHTSSKAPQPGTSVATGQTAILASATTADSLVSVAAE